jgi:hypothetical protein
LINVGTGHDITIRELAMQVQHTVGYTGEIVFDTTQPDGTPRKLMAIGRARCAAGLEPQPEARRSSRRRAHRTGAPECPQ